MDLLFFLYNNKSVIILSLCRLTFGSFPDNKAVGGEGQSQDTTSKAISSYFQEEKVQPFHYSSSIYYGGQDVYSRPQSAQNTTVSNLKRLCELLLKLLYLAAVLLQVMTFIEISIHFLFTFI